MKHKLIVLFLTAFLAGTAAGQTSRGLPEGPGPGNLVVRVLSPMGDSLPVQAIVKITANSGGFYRTEATREAARATFSAIPYGDYQIEASAPGYDPGLERIDVLPGQTVQAFVSLKPEGSSRRALEPRGPNTVLTPKAQKDLELGLAAMNSGDTDKARSLFEKVRKNAPGHPEPHFLLGALAYRSGQWEDAEKCVRQALSLNPKHANGNGLLGRLLVRANKYDEAITALEAALVEDAENWENRGLLGRLLYQKGDFVMAAAQLQRALSDSSGKAPRLKVALAYALAQSGKPDKAIQQVEEFVKQYPQDPEARAALDLRKRLESAAAKVAPNAVPIPVRAVVPDPDADASPESPDWAPRDVDETTPYVAPDVTCSLPGVLKSTGKEIAQFSDSLQKVTANELVEFADLSPRGTPRNILSKQFVYMVAIERVGKHSLSVDEYRDGVMAGASSSSRMATRGLAALALIFHPDYSVDFDFRCEGLGQWKGQPAWLLHFQQKTNVPNRTRSYTTAQGKFPVHLKGRAWIAANTYKILRLETDLLAPVEKVELDREHITVEYQPVKFQAKNVELWLPARAEMFSKLKGKRYRQRHQFSDFTYFSVETKQKISEPKDMDQGPPR